MRFSARRRLTILAAAVLAAVALTAGSASGAPSTGQAPSTARHRAVLVVDGAVAHRLRLNLADLAALPQQTITVTFQSGAGPQTHTYTGPLLLDVLGQAQPRFDPAVKNDKLRHVVTATGSDGYQTAVAWGEFDPDFEHKTILVAVTEDGTPPADGLPRLVAPGDQRRPVRVESHPPAAAPLTARQKFRRVRCWHERG
ncbi:molybdopterin-dependent oxidoreductase [Dactylosporangium sp. NPDC000555]|uniref:molybdopterin-dependent oxidoreductase n=1 Tax=Dactylosporangium sp. NPDC000555 TaxID=3154260 RepID=UPI003321B3BB